MKVICVFCSSSNSVDESYHRIATDLGHRIGQLGFDLVYGGGKDGLMGAVARGVHGSGGRVVGVIPEFFRKKNKNIEYADADELIVTSTMHDRKAIMYRRSDAFIALPGGVGTLEEVMEILSMKQLGLTDKPFALINKNKFYDNLIFHFQKMIELKFANKSVLDSFAVCPDPAAALDSLIR